MIRLYGLGSQFGLPDASPFVTKIETLLRMAGLPFEKLKTEPRRAPKGKVPYIEDEDLILSDSTFIRWHIERKYGIDFERGLSAEQRATSWAFEKMAEDSLYWASLHFRWMDTDNFRRGPLAFFNDIPLPLRSLAIRVVRRRIRSNLRAHGMGRHTSPEIATLGIRCVESFSDYLGDKPYFMGREPTGIDATAFAFTASVMCPIFKSDLQMAAAKRSNLQRFLGRMTARLYPDQADIADTLQHLAIDVSDAPAR